MRVPERDSKPMEGGLMPVAVKTTIELEEKDTVQKCVKNQRAC